MPRTIEPWKSSACLPKRAVKRRTVLRLTLHSRAVARTPQPSARCSAMAASVSSLEVRPNRGVLARSEKSVPQVAQCRQRTRLLRPDQPCRRRLAEPRWPYLGHSGLGQARCENPSALIADASLDGLLPFSAALDS